MFGINQIKILKKEKRRFWTKLFIVVQVVETKVVVLGTGSDAAVGSLGKVC